MIGGTNSCNRGEDMVVYLYGEASPELTHDFEQHVKSCSGCREELDSFVSLRGSLKEWQIEAQPRIEVSIQRRPLEIFRELVTTLPRWMKIGGLAAASAALVLFSLALSGTRIDWREGTVKFGIAEGGGPRESRVSDASPSRQLTRAEIDTMIDERVKTVRMEQAQHLAELNAQVASLNLQLTRAGEAQSKLVQSLASVRKEQRTLMARSQSTLGEWLFASSGTTGQDGSNDREN